MKKLLLAFACVASIGGSYAQETAAVTGSNDLKVRFDGRVTFDGSIYLPSTNLSGVKYGMDDFRFSNGVNVSQLRLGLNAMFGSRWLGRFDVDFSNRRVNLTDIILCYSFNKNSKLIIGHYKDPVSMDNSTPSRLLQMQGPMAVGVLTRGERYLGATYINWGRNHWFGGGFYAGNMSRVTEINRGDDGYGISARVAWIPINNDYMTVHLGGSGRFRRPDAVSGSTGEYRPMSYSGVPESVIDGHKFLSLSLSDVKTYILGGAEVGIKYDKFYLTGEYLFNHFNRRNGVTNFIHGWTITASYMLMGNQRQYVQSEGYFNAVSPNTGGTSLELIARAGQVDLNDSGNAHSLNAGKSSIFLLGLNWYPHANFLFGINYSYVDNDQYANAGGQLLGVGASGIDFHQVQLRAQFTF